MRVRDNQTPLSRSYKTWHSAVRITFLFCRTQLPSQSTTQPSYTAFTPTTPQTTPRKNHPLTKLRRCIIVSLFVCRPSQKCPRVQIERKYVVSVTSSSSTSSSGDRSDVWWCLLCVYACVAAVQGSPPQQAPNNTRRPKSTCTQQNSAAKHTKKPARSKRSLSKFGRRSRHQRRSSATTAHMMLRDAHDAMRTPKKTCMYIEKYIHIHTIQKHTEARLNRNYVPKKP